ncbi:MAG: 50S ribosomal protein L11 methyltransferase [Prevotella sp.]|nr:50S ribosomal protein L11 methyltransferase [Prevotella sp.]
MKYFVAEFVITCPSNLLQVARDLVADAAGETGFESFEDTPTGLKGYVQDDALDREALDRELAELPLDEVSVSYTLQDAEDKDWNEEWEMAGFDPINIDNQVVIYDARQDEQPLVPDTMPVYIRARQAFGTGNHQTTRMVIAALLNTSLQGKRVLDCGCGTGILGIVASKLGAEEVVAYDIDEWSVENTRHNAEHNGVENITVLHGNASVLSHVCGVFDIVMANINRNILIDDLSAFKEVLAADGIIILSGFYETDIPMIQQEATALNLTEVSRQVEDDWCCLILRENK